MTLVKLRIYSLQAILYVTLGNRRAAVEWWKWQTVANGNRISRRLRANTAGRLQISRYRGRRHGM